MYNLEEFDNRIGYKIPWDELEKMLDALYPDSTYGNGWYEGWKCNNWVKKDENENIEYDRSYLKLRRYKNRELKTERSLGYYDNLLEAYIITDRRSKVTDVVKEYQESEE